MFDLKIKEYCIKIDADESEISIGWDEGTISHYLVFETKHMHHAYCMERLLNQLGYVKTEDSHEFNWDKKFDKR